MKTRGITVIEIMIVIGIMSMVAALTFVSFTSLNSKESIDKAATVAMSILNEARASTLSSVGDSVYGVHIEASRIVLFPGASYVLSHASNTPTEIGSRVGIKNILLTGGGSDIVFERQTGATSQSGSFEVYLISDPTQYKTVTIYSTGLVSAL